MTIGSAIVDHLARRPNVAPKRVDVLLFDRLARSADVPLQLLDVVALVDIIARVVDELVEAGRFVDIPDVTPCEKLIQLAMYSLPSEIRFFDYVPRRCPSFV